VVQALQADVDDVSALTSTPAFLAVARSSLTPHPDQRLT